MVIRGGTYMKPNKSYTIWFSVRTGSTLLCKALESTRVAGIPNEWLLTGQYNANNNPYDIQQELWKKGTSDNGVLGIKFSMHNPCFNNIIKLFKQLPGGKEKKQDIHIWNNALPNCKHIFMTRGNKVRLAVSWWRAIQSGEWGRRHGSKPKVADLVDKYSFDAINHLVMECTMREAGIQELFSQVNIIPFTIVYEDFILDYKNTVLSVLDYLDIEYDNSLHICEPYFDRIADGISEEWAQRFRKERQVGWDNIGW